MKGRQTSKQLADLQEKRTSLFRRIQRWHEVQLTYVPCVGPILATMLCSAEETNTPPDPAEHMPLYLPSSLPRQLLDTHDLTAILEKEKRLRIAQADDALAEIRRQRRIITGLWHFKKLNVAGTGNKPNTRMRSLYNRFNNKTQRCAARYRAAYAALMSLDPHGTWRERLRVLHKKDIRGPGKENDGSSNGRFEPSWIWLVPRVDSAPDMGISEGHLDESMRPEWAKSQARMKRWEEELAIVGEEMRRVVVYLEWRAGWWRAQGQRRRDVGSDESDILDGVEAYSQKQAAIAEGLALSCARYWLPMLQRYGLDSEWGSRYVLSTQPIPTSAPHESHADDSADDDAIDPDEPVDLCEVPPEVTEHEGILDVDFDFDMNADGDLEIEDVYELED